jgi:hypothetical protein
MTRNGTRKQDPRGKDQACYAPADKTFLFRSRGVR